MAVERARQAQEMRRILTPEQFAQLQEMRDERQRPDAAGTGAGASAVAAIAAARPGG